MRRGRKKAKVEHLVREELRDLIFPICLMFFERAKSVTEITEWVCEELKRRERKVPFSRQQVYPVITAAVQLGYVRFCPPWNMTLAQRIADLNKTGVENVSVVNAAGSSGLKHLASRAAEMTVDLIKRRAATKGREEGGDVAVHLGLGAGHTTMLVAKQLGQLLRSVERIKGVSKLVLHAMSSGFTVTDPLLCPVVFFSHFSDLMIPIEYVSLYSDPMVPYEEYESIKQRPGAREAFQRASEIDIVITSMASHAQGTGLLDQIEKEYGGQVQAGEDPDAPPRVGDVQFRPYSKLGPILARKGGIRAVTLFELADFVRMTREGKYVILVAGSSRDGKTKSDALLPLLTEPSLRVWSHLCLDRATAGEIIEMQGGGPDRVTDLVAGGAASHSPAPSPVAG